VQEHQSELNFFTISGIVLSFQGRAVEFSQHWIGKKVQAGHEQDGRYVAKTLARLDEPRCDGGPSVGRDHGPVDHVDGDVVLCKPGLERDVGRRGIGGEAAGDWKEQEQQEARGGQHRTNYCTVSCPPTSTSTTWSNTTTPKLKSEVAQQQHQQSDSQSRPTTLRYNHTTTRTRSLSIGIVVVVDVAVAGLPSLEDEARCRRCNRVLLSGVDNDTLVLNQLINLMQAAKP